MKIQVLLNKRGMAAEGWNTLSLLIRRKSQTGKVVDIRAKVNIEIDPSKYDEKEKTVKTFTKGSRTSADRIHHNDNVAKLNDLLNHIEKEFGKLVFPDDATSSWLEGVVNTFLNPDYQEEEKKRERTNIYKMMMDFVEKKKDTSIFYRKNFLVMVRSLARYEKYVRLTENKAFVLNLNVMGRNEIEDYKSYLLNEYELMQEKPKIFAKIVNNYPSEITPGNSKIEQRGSNAVFKILKLFKTFCKWAKGEKLIINDPFEGWKFSDLAGKETYADPWFMTREERNKVAETPMPTKSLEVQRDIFVFQCLIGCRVYDLTKLTADNISNGILHYIPHKTKDKTEEAQEARIPLNDKALELVNKYKGKDSKGRLFPFISDQKYNEAIKKVLTVAEITRKVSVRNALTGEIELRPLNEIGCSHMARRTFVGCLYARVQDPNTIGKMSGHVEGSKAFERYRKVTDDILRQTISLL